MKKQKVGLVIFWISVIWMISWVIVGAIKAPLMHSLTMKEINQTIWALTGPLNMLYGVVAIPLGAIVTGVGILLYARAKGLTV